MENDDVVAQFTEVTGSSLETATQYLQITDFNIEQATMLFFENGGAPLTEEPMPSSTAPSGPRTSDSRERSGVINVDSDDDVMVDETRSAPRSQPAPGLGPHIEDDEAMARRLQEEIYSSAGGGSGGGGGVDADGVRAPMGRTTETLVGPEDDFDDDEVHETILNQLRSRHARRGRPGIFNQRDPQSIWTDTDAPHDDRLSEATGGASNTSSKSNMLAEMYRPPFEIMSKLPWDLARQEGREAEKWLLINIQDASIFDCQVLNRDLWKDPAVKETVKEHFIFLQFAKEDPRATPYLQYYFQGHDISDNYPHIAIVDPRTGEQMKVWSGPPVVKPADFLIQLHEFLDRYSLSLNVRNPVAKRKPERPEKSVDKMTEEEMMDMAVRNSLGGADPASQKMEDPDDLTRSTEDVKGKGKAVDKDVTMGGQEEKEEGEKDVFSTIPGDRFHTEPPPDPATTTRIQFRHPSGRVIRRFALSDPVQRIYEWLKSEPPLEGKAGVPFELNALGHNLVDQLQTSIADAGLKNGTVMIGYLED